jgi:hypothetical protein
MKLFLFSLAFLAIETLFAQVIPDSLNLRIKDTCWKTNGFIGLNFSQTALSNWQGGGQDNIAFTGILDYEANYRKDKLEWSNKLDVQYGIVLQGNSKFWKKNVDQIFAMTQLNGQISKKYWFSSLMADFRSQLAPGYQYSGDTSRNLISKWAAPTYIQLALGVDFRLKDYFSATISPAAGKVTIVNDQTMANSGAFGVQVAKYDTSGKMISPGKKVRYEFGGRFTLKFKKDIGKNINVDTYLDLFSNYFHNPQNIDVVWNTLITFKINKFFSATVSTKLLYDDDIIIKYDWDKDGKYTGPHDINGPRVQLLSNIGVGLGYKF